MKHDKKKHDKKPSSDISAKIDKQTGHNTNGSPTRDDPDTTLSGRGNEGSAHGNKIAKNKNQL